MRSEYWHERNALFKKELSEVSKNAFVFVGDSITEGFPLKHFFPDWPTVNRGINGDHIDGVIERLDISAILLNPRHLFLMIGINDIGEKRSTACMQEQYEKLFPLLKNQLTETSFYIHSLLPIGRERGVQALNQVKEVNQFLKQSCRKHGFNFINLFPQYTDKNGFLNKQYSNDGLHLNPDGYALWADTLHALFIMDKQ